MSLASRLWSTVLGMLVIYAITFWAYPSWQSSLIAAMAVGALSLLNTVRSLRRAAKSGMSADTLWYFFGSTFVFWIIAFIVDWLIHR